MLNRVTREAPLLTKQPHLNGVTRHNHRQCVHLHAIVLKRLQVKLCSKLLHNLGTQVGARGILLRRMGKVLDLARVPVAEHDAGGLLTVRHSALLQLALLDGQEGKEFGTILENFCFKEFLIIATILLIQ